MKELITATAGLGAGFLERLDPAFENRGMKRRARHGRRTRTRGRRRDHTTPHGSPFYIAICRRPDDTGRKYHACATRDQALRHKPYIVERVNAWGQVSRRERFAPATTQSVNTPAEEATA